MRDRFVLFFLFISLTLYAQNDAPSSIDLIIPPIIVEFEGRSEQVMELVVPDYEEIILPDFEVTLADPDEIPIGEIDFDLPMPDPVDYTYSKESSFFSEGMLGLGLKNHLSGNISLFSLGKDLRFSLSFAHEGLDGFGQNDPGTGYFMRDETFQGDLERGDDNFSMTASGLFSEQENGLQQLVPNHSSVIHRFKSINLGFTLNDYFLWTGSAGIDIAGKTISGETPETLDETVFSFDAGMGWKNEWMTYTFTGGYIYNQGSLLNRNIITGNMVFDFSLPAVDISASAGLFWIPGSLVTYPFSIDLSGAVKDLFRYQVSGGYSLDYYSNYKVWGEYPYAGLGDGVNRKWYWNGSLGFSPVSRLEAGFGWSLRKMENYISADPDIFNTSTGLFSITASSGSFLDLSSFAKFDFTRNFSVLLSWKGQLLEDKDVLNPLQLLHSELGYNGENWGMFVSGDFSLSAPASVPDVSVGANYSLSEGVELILEGTDIFGFFTADRNLWGNYIDDGGRLTLKTKISL